MKIECEPSENQLLGYRKGSAIIGNKIVSIPTPIVTSTEINYADSVTETGKAKKIKFPHDIFEIKKFINKKSFAKDFMTSTNRGALLNDIKDQTEKAEKYFEKKPIKMITPVLLDDLKVDQRVIEELVNIQIEANMDIINIPDSKKTSPENLKKIFQQLTTTIKDNKKEAFYLITIKAGNRSFVNKIGNIKGSVGGITAIYADAHEKYDNYMYLMNLASDRSLFRIVSNVPRMVSKNVNGALFPLSFLVSDAYSTEYVIIKSKKGKKKKDPIPRRLDIETLEYFSADESISMEETNPYCDCPICEDYSIDEMKYIYDDHLRHAFRVHETFAAKLFVERCKSISDDESLKGFLLSIPGAKKALSHSYMPEIGQEQFLSQGK